MFGASKLVFSQFIKLVVNLASSVSLETLEKVRGRFREKVWSKFGVGLD